MEALDEVGEVVVRRVAEHAEGAGAGLERLDGAHRVDAVVDRADSGLRVLAEGERRFGRHEPTAAAGEQAHLELALEPRDELRDGRLCRVQLDGGGRERAEFECEQERAQLGDRLCS